ncbi:MAG: hypothetical protein B7733_18680 [Myxococcales bacterium FL481]|nr:MAG: hypothetical protein B7733_18680 [Myxococcales bacterium FL481]
MSKKKTSRKQVEPPQDPDLQNHAGGENAENMTPVSEATVVSAVDMAALRFDDETPEAWVRKVVGLEDSTGAAVAKLRLEVRQTRAEPFRRLLEIPLRGRSPTEVVHQIETEAGNSGYRMVRVSAWFSRGKAPVSIFLWPTDDAAIEEEEGLGGKPSDVLRQTLRHNEVLMTTMMNSQTMAMRHLVAENDKLSKLAEQHLAERLELIELIRQQRIGAAEEVSTMKRGDALLGMGQTLTNAVAFWMTHGKGNPSAREDVLLKMLRGLGQSLSSEQVAMLEQTLSAEQFAVLHELTRDPKAYGDTMANAQSQAATSQEDSDGNRV